MCTVYTVGTVKRVELDGGAVRTYVSVDGGMSDNIRTALYDADYSCTLASRASDAPPVLGRVVGKHCEAGDIVVKDEFLPGDVAPGDLVAVPATGAYCRSMASNYNHALRPPVVAVRDGVATTVVRRETEDDLLATDLGAHTRETAERRRARLRRRRLPGRPAAHRAGRRPGRAGRRARSSWSGSPYAGSTRRATSRCPRVCSPPTPPALVARDDVDVVVEVIGGIEPARSLILAALENGATVVTANKALLAEDGPTLFEAAEKAGRDLYYEAAVAGAIPILRPLRESLAGDRVTRVLGIVNGTTNFILDKMDTTGAGFEEALEEAQELGYAEADPTADVEGFDAAAKAAILASLAFHTRVTAADVHREGITDVTAADIASAREMGSVVKLLAIAELARRSTRGGAGRLRARAPGDDPEVAPAGQRPRGVQRGVRRVRGGRSADVLRPRRRRRADRERGARRPRHGGPQPARRRPAAPASRRTPTASCCRWARPRPATTSRSTSTTARACSPRSRRPSPSTTSRSRRCARRAAATTPSSSWSPTTRPTPSSPRPSSGCAA